MASTIGTARGSTHGSWRPLAHRVAGLPVLPAWFENRPTDQWPVFPVWGMYFRNVKKVDVQDVKLFVKGKEYRKAWMVDNVKKHNLNVVDVR